MSFKSGSVMIVRQAIASYEACVIFPYDVSQMRLYELYALAFPLFVPERKQLPSYIYRGLTTIEDSADS
eukprot:g11377.t1